MDFDETRLYYSHQQLQSDRTEGTGDGEEGRLAAAVHQDYDNDDDGVDLSKARRHFREFLRNYRLGQSYVYRDQLLRMHRRWSTRLALSSSSLSSSALQLPATTEGSSSVVVEDRATAAAAAAAPHANHAKIHVDLAHVGEYDTALLGSLLNQPARMLPTMEQAATDALETLLFDMNRRRGTGNTANTEANPGQGAGGDDDDDYGMDPAALGEANTNTARSSSSNSNNNKIPIQILLKGNLQATPLRTIKSEHMNRLLKCPGIVISTTPVKNRAIHLHVRCHSCLDRQTVHATEGPFGGIALPMKCSGVNATECGRFPYTVVPDESQFVDQQTLKLQEAPERVPTGEMPRSVLLTVERSLVDMASPGTRVSVLCIPTLFTQGGGGRGGGGSTQGNDAKAVYLRVVGLVKDNDAHGDRLTFTPSEEQAFTKLARRPDVYDILSRSMAPNIQGSYTVDIKKALVCQLLGGSRKRLPDGVRLRGDINCLLLGDPSMAKSQFLKFVSKVAPVGIYTSGKGSSAAGLTASVVKDSKGEFYLEGGAMVLADGGIVCIDEFDKMRPNDRVAIHEAMEQQTISIAKAGITTVLNSRSSVLAAANPVFGRYDELQSAADNIDLMTTILSRFDLIFLVRDVREEERDRLICQHVMGVHISQSRAAAQGNTSGGWNGGGLAGQEDDLGASNGGDHGSGSNSTEAIVENVTRVASTGAGELDVAAMRKYIQYCKAKCFPRLSEEAGEVLTSSYVKIRDDVRKQCLGAAPDGGGGTTQSTIPITVRQLEALVRLSESLAKLRLDADVKSEDVTEALRLFRVSTMAANSVDQDKSGPGATALGAPNRAEMDRSETFLRNRLTIGSSVNKQKLVEEAAGQGFNAMIVARALSVMVGRGELLERNQGRLLKRLK